MNVTSHEDSVLFEAVGEVAVITLNRPHALNSIDGDMALQLGLALERLDADPRLRVGILTGTGRAFCAGMDLKAWAAGDNARASGYPEWGFAGIVQHRLTSPLIAAVNGFALGGGMEVALACDLIVATESAQFALPEVTHGIIPGGGGALRLAQQLPARIATELALTGRRMSAVEAERWGLVNRVLPDHELLAGALELAQKIAANAPLAVQATKRLMADTLNLNSWEPDAWVLNDRAEEAVWRSEDAREGGLAFAEKRSPNWSGR